MSEKAPQATQSFEDFQAEIAQNEPEAHRRALAAMEAERGKYATQEKYESTLATGKVAVADLIPAEKDDWELESDAEVERFKSSPDGIDEAIDKLYKSMGEADGFGDDIASWEYEQRAFRLENLKHELLTHKEGK